MCSCDDGGPDVWNETLRRARKAHVCYECRGDIAVGEHYVYISGVWEGRGESFHWCRGCNAWKDALEEALRTSDVCVCWQLGSLWEAIRYFCQEALGYDPRPARRAA